MSSLCKQARWKEVSTILHLVYLGSTQENCKAFARLLQDCVNNKDVEQGKRLHAYGIKAGLGTFSFLNTHLVNMYAKCDKMESARQVFDEMRNRSVVSWTAVIAGYVQNGYCQEALYLFPRMRRDSIEPDEFTFPCVLKACTGLQALWTGKQDVL